MTKFLHRLVALLLGFVALSQRALQFHQVPSQFQLRLHLPAQSAKGVALLARKFPRHTVDYAQCSQRIAARTAKRRPGIKTNLGFRHNEGIGFEAFVLARVRHDEQIRLLDGAGAERHLARRQANRNSDARLEPLAVLVNQSNESYWSLAYVGGEQGKIIEALF